MINFGVRFNRLSRVCDRPNQTGTESAAHSISHETRKLRQTQLTCKGVTIELVLSGQPEQRHKGAILRRDGLLCSQRSSERDHCSFRRFA